jgi:DNA-directed RNA polymerase subunit RPC12/RpoP
MGMRRQFEQFDATELYCPRCRRAMPVRPRLLLVLPEGDLHAYHCARCGEVLGKKTVRPIAGSAQGGAAWKPT